MTRNHSKRTGGLGSLTHPLSDEDYRRQMDKLSKVNAADSPEPREPTEEEQEAWERLCEKHGWDYEL